jgi:hypothetical protein
MDSLEKITKLRKEDVIFSENEILYRITKVSDSSVTLFKINSLDDNLKIVSMDDMMKENWHLL